MRTKFPRISPRAFRGVALDDHPTRGRCARQADQRDNLTGLVLIHLAAALEDACLPNRLIPSSALRPSVHDDSVIVPMGVDLPGLASVLPIGYFTV